MQRRPAGEPPVQERLSRALARSCPTFAERIERRALGAPAPRLLRPRGSRRCRTKGAPMAPRSRPGRAPMPRRTRGASTRRPRQSSALRATSSSTRTATACPSDTRCSPRARASSSSSMRTCSASPTGSARLSSRAHTITGESLYQHIQPDAGHQDHAPPAVHQQPQEREQREIHLRSRPTRPRNDVLDASGGRRHPGAQSRPTR